MQAKVFEILSLNLSKLNRWVLTEIQFSMNVKVANFSSSYLIYSLFQKINNPNMEKLSIIAFFNQLIFFWKFKVYQNYLIIMIFIRGTNFKTSKY